MRARRFITLLVFLLPAGAAVLARPAGKGVAFIECVNPLGVPRVDALASIPLRDLRGKPVAFRDGATVIPHQVVDGRVLLLLTLGARETKKLSVEYSGDPPLFRKRTQADLAVKVGYVLTGGEYTGGRFERVQTAGTPPGNRSHNAFFKYEGPGWESELVGYRLYLDERSRCDIFGKKEKVIVLHTVGVNDLVSDGKESYQNMQEWGRDMFKVGASLGIGSYALWFDGRPRPVEDFDSARCRIAADGPIYSEVFLKYHGWKAGGKSRELEARLSIAAGSRLTDVDLDGGRGPGNFCTGLAKHDGCALMTSTATGRSGWGYVALYGKQALTGDNLGTAIFYRLRDCVRITEDSLSQIVVLRPRKGRIEYSFAAAWQQEPDGVRNADEFRSFLDSTVAALGAPVRVRIEKNGIKEPK